MSMQFNIPTVEHKEQIIKIMQAYLDEYKKKHNQENQEILAELNKFKLYTNNYKVEELIEYIGIKLVPQLLILDKNLGKTLENLVKSWRSTIESKTKSLRSTNKSLDDIDINLIFSLQKTQQILMEENNGLSKELEKCQDKISSLTIYSDSLQDLLSKKDLELAKIEQASENSKLNSNPKSNHNKKL